MKIKLLIVFGKTELTNATHDLYTLLAIIFLRMITLNMQQNLKEDLLILPRYFTFFLSRYFHFYYLFSNSHAQRNIPSIYVGRCAIWYQSLFRVCMIIRTRVNAC